MCLLYLSSPRQWLGVSRVWCLQVLSVSWEPDGVRTKESADAGGRWNMQGGWNMQPSSLLWLAFKWLQISLVSVPVENGGRDPNMLVLNGSNGADLLAADTTIPGSIWGFRQNAEGRRTAHTTAALGKDHVHPSPCPRKGAMTPTHRGEGEDVGAENR